MKKLILILFGLTPLISTAQWDSLGRGLNRPVEALITYKGNLMAGNYYYSSIDTVAAWNGNSWLSKPKSTYSDYGQIKAFTIDSNNVLYAGGAYDSIGGVRAIDIASWDGTSWKVMLGLSSYAIGGVDALVPYKGDIYAGGRFFADGSLPIHNIAKWNSTSWEILDSGLNFTVSALCVYNGNLYAGGQFNYSDTMQLNHIAIWDGTKWSAAGAGLNNYVNALVVFNGNLIAGGSFDSAGGMPANGLAQWNGSSWSAFGKGINASGSVNALTAYNGYLVAAGSFDSIGGIAANNIATTWDGSSWTPLGPGTNDAIYSVAFYNNNLYAGGQFDSAGGIHTNSIAEWSGPLGLNEMTNSSDNIDVFPNPSHGIFTIRFNNYQNAGKSTITIYNMLGKLIMSTSLNAKTTSIDLSSNSTGIYLYRIVSEQGSPVANGKLIIQ